MAFDPNNIFKRVDIPDIGEIARENLQNATGLQIPGLNSNETGIDRLKAHVVASSGLFSRQNRFAFQVLAMPGTKVGNSLRDQSKLANFANKWNQVQTRNKINFNCKAIDWPGSSIATQEIARPADSQKSAYARLFPNLASQFYVSENLDEYQFFTEWQNLAIDGGTGRSGYFNDYTGEIRLQMLNLQQRVVYQFEITDAFPVTVGTMTLDYSSDNAINILPVTWAWRTKSQNQTDFVNDTVGETVIRQLSRQSVNRFENILRQQVTGLIDLDAARNASRIIGLGGFI